MSHSVRVGNFLPSVHGFPFPNSYPPDRPFHLFNTPFGVVSVADASRGLCGGMIFTVMDLFYLGLPVPKEPVEPVFRYICQRLFTSWGVPFAWSKYWDWQLRPAVSKSVAGVVVRSGVTRLTILEEWPKIRAGLDSGELVPLGLVKESGVSPAKLGMNHQVLGYGYDLYDDTGDVTVRVYDPNYPLDDTITLTWNLSDADTDRRVVHSWEGPSVRGVFHTEYRPPLRPPQF
jgi:hypothetical protein